MRKISTIFLLAVTSISLLTTGESHAVRARHAPREAMNPDGVTVTLTQMGDEFFHCYVTQDGYPVLADKSGFYRIVANDGTMTSIRALNPGERTSDIASAMRAVNPHTAYTSLLNASLHDNQLYENCPQRKPQMRLSESKYDNEDGHDRRAFPCEGQQNVLVILVDFPDKPFTFCENPAQEMKDVMGKRGYSNFGASGSALDYFETSSHGLFNPSFDVYGPVTMSKEWRWYGQNNDIGNDKYAAHMVKEACELLDGEIDFSKYDRDGDNFVDNIYVIYAGRGENDPGSPSENATDEEKIQFETDANNLIWPHAYTLASGTGSSLQLDGVYLNKYGCSAELQGDDSFCGIGTFCHEFSHILGLPDLYAVQHYYDTDFNPDVYYVTPWSWSILDYGPYNNNGMTPPLYSSYEQYALEWLKPIEIRLEDNTPSQEIVLPPLTRSDVAYKITRLRSDNLPSPEGEYILLENRQKEGWDEFLPGEGMLAWHIDFWYNLWYDQSINNSVNHQFVDIMEAAGDIYLRIDDLKADAKEEGYAAFPKYHESTPFPGTIEAFDFTATSKPATLKPWWQETTGYGLYGIEQNADGTVSFDLVLEGSADHPVEADRPNLRCDNLCATGFTAAWDAIDQASDYFLTVYPVTDGILSASPVPDWVGEYRTQSTAGETSVDFSGLIPGTMYYVGVAARTESGLSRPSVSFVKIPIADTPLISPALYVKSIDNNVVTLAWNEIKDAESYDVTIATRSDETSTEIATLAVEGDKLPEGWETTGIAANNAITLTAQADFLRSPIFDTDIASVSFKPDFNNDDQRGRVEIYAIFADGSMQHVCEVRLDTLTNEPIMIEMPAGSRSFALYYYYTRNGQQMKVTDLSITFNKAYTDTPVEGYDKLNVKGTEITASLQPETEYVAYAVARIGNTMTETPPVLRFKTRTSDIKPLTTPDLTITVNDGVVTLSDPTEEYSIFSADGLTIAKEIHGDFRLPARGIYVVRTTSAKSRLVVN